MGGLQKSLHSKTVTKTEKKTNKNVKADKNWEWIIALLEGYGAAGILIHFCLEDKVPI